MPDVVYLLICQCQSYYVGKMKLEFWRRASKHIISMTNANPDLPLGRHVRDCHRGISPRVHFTILDRVHPDNRGEDWNKLLLRGKVQWIAELNATRPPGLSTQFSYRPFLESFASGGCEKK